jgi:acyl-CoA synthetase (AMP-forming)/AMP-acid ligase II
MANTHSIMMAKFTPERALEYIQKYRITDALLVPTMLNMMFNVPNFADYDLSSLKRICYGAAPMPEPLVRRFMAEMPDLQAYQGYGMTEASPLVTVLAEEAHDPDGPLADKLTSIGQPVYHCEVRIVDENDNDVPNGEVGELVVRGPNIMKGYWNQPELTAEAKRGGWYHTGDAGRMDDDGYIFLVDRVKDMIVSGGENVYSAEVESVLHDHPAVKECAVIGIPSEKWGEAVHALITLKDGQSFNEADIIAFCQERIAHYKCPKAVEVIDAMPLSGVNKILKTELRKPYWKGHESKVV